jgi:hypothetical protein
MKTQSEIHKIPEHLTAIVFADGKPSPGLVIMVSLKMITKNGLNIVFGPSNKDGKVEVSKKDLEKEAARILHMFPMDYADLSAFKGKIIVRAMDLADLESALGAYDLYHDSADYPPVYRDKLATATTALSRLGAKRLDVKVTAMPSNGKTRIITQSVMASGRHLAKRSG